MVRDYELMFIVRPDVDDDGLRASVDSVRGIIEAQGGELRKTTMWGKRRLAYEVKHLRDGHYVIAEIRLDGARVAALERALGIHDTVFRHLLVVQEVPSAEGEEEGAEAGENGAEPVGAVGAPSSAEAPTLAGDADGEAGPAESATLAETTEPSAAVTGKPSTAEPAATATEEPGATEPAAEEEATAPGADTTEPEPAPEPATQEEE